MNVWVIRDLEPLPTDPGGRRLMAAGLLSDALARAGHDTTWFTSSFEHGRKRQRSDRDTVQRLSDKLTIQIFKAPGYKRNVSLKRIYHNRYFANSFLRYADKSAVRPDALITSVPTTEMGHSVVKLGRQWGIPSIVLIRDLWPDFFIDYAPAFARPFARIAVSPLDAQARYACRFATSVVGISEKYLQWGQRKGGRTDTSDDRIFPLGYRPTPVSTSRDDILKKLGVALDKKLVSYVGTWGISYDLDLVAKTAAEMASRTDVQFVVTGDGSQRPELLAEFQRLPNVALTGWVGAKEIAAILAGSSIGLLPYVANAPQGLPNKVFEYMAYGTYQVSTLGGEVARLYEETDTGISLPNATPRQLAEAITAALDASALLSGMRERIAVFDSRFHADRVFEGLVAHITALTQRAKPAR